MKQTRRFKAKNVFLFLQNEQLEFQIVQSLYRQYDYVPLNCSSFSGVKDNKLQFFNQKLIERISQKDIQLYGTTLYNIRPELFDVQNYLNNMEVIEHFQILVTNNSTSQSILKLFGENVGLIQIDEGLQIE